MVQRKVPKKLGIQAADHAISEKLLANFKPLSLQQKEIKNKGGHDLKKTMKKSGSLKKMKGPKEQPGKHLATPKKPVMDTTPNYMKSTTSSDARKEIGFQVSSRSPQAFSSDGKYSVRRKLLNSNSKANSYPGNTGARTLSRISSLKLVRSLTKTHSFKQTRVSATKCSSLILSENLNVQRATCSSTIKDHKCPDYLSLSKTEGTSIMKVCSYTYCSLNGHHYHDTLPPLKSFLSARRRMLKAQRSIKIGCLSPRRPKPVPETVNDIQAEQGGPLEEDSLIQEMNPGFFIEICGQQMEDHCQMNQHTANENSPEEILYPLNLDQDETELEFLNFLYGLEEENTPIIQSEEEHFEKHDIEWEPGEVHCGASYPGGAKPVKINHMIDLENENSSIESCLLDEEILTKDEVVIEDGNKSLPDEILQEAIYIDFEEGSGSEELDYYEDDTVSVHSTFLEEALIEDSHDVGTSVFEYPHDLSSNITEKLSISIGTQTENGCDDQQVLNENVMDEMHKLSIATQTDHDQPAALIESPCYDNAQLDGSLIVPESSLVAPERSLVVPESKEAFNSAHEEIINKCKIKKGTSRVIEANNVLTEFNPRAPNFLSAEPEPDAEKVDLRHLSLGEKKNAEDWMVDHAIQQAVTKLARARKRKVALLVEAFETVSPSLKREYHFRHSSIASPQARTIQACS